LGEMLDFDWSEFEGGREPDFPVEEKDGHEFTINFDSEMMLEMVNAELDRITQESGRSRSEALCLAMAGSASLSVEELTEKYVNVLSVPISTNTESPDLTEAIL